MDSVVPAPEPRPRRMVTIRADTQAGLDLVAAALGLTDAVALNVCLNHGVKSMQEVLAKAGLLALDPPRLIDPAAPELAEVDVTNG